MTMEPSEFRRVLGHWVTGVGVVATRLPESGGPCGLTANAIASVSLEPPLVLACVERGSDSHDPIAEMGYFSISVLDGEQERISRRFALWDLEEKFSGLAWRTEATGAPVLDGALAWVDCRVRASHPAGDHTIYVGEVVAGDADEGAPLAYYRGGYGRFVP